MNKPTIAVILGSIREGRAIENVAAWFLHAVHANPDAHIELLDLKDFPLPMFADAVAPAYREGAHANPLVQAWLDKIAAADGFIIISPEYNHGYSSVLKNAIDYGSKEWAEKPVGFVGYGGAAGGARAVEQLRQVVGELRMYDVRDQILIPSVWAAFDDQTKLLHGNEAQERTANHILSHVATLATKLRA